MSKDKKDKVKDKVVDKLTPEQEAMIPKYVEKYLKIGLSTDSTDRAAAEAAIIKVYSYQKNKDKAFAHLTTPKFVWADSPMVGVKMAAQYATGKDVVTQDDLREAVSNASYGSFEAYWVSFYAFVTEQLGVEHDGLIDIVKDIIDNVGVYWTFEDMVVATEKPTSIHIKDNQLHNPDGLALEYKNGDGLFRLNGKRFDSLLEMKIQDKLGTTEEE